MVKRMNLMEINYIDNFLTEEQHNVVNQYCLNADYNYGESDLDGFPCTGMVSNILNTDPMYGMLENSILNKIKELVEDKELYRMYVNCFASSERPYFHTDGNKGNITFLYYPNLEWCIDDGGETQFLVDENLYGVLPIPNRLLLFDASIMHRATSFRQSHRFTVAIKYKINKEKTIK